MGGRCSHRRREEPQQQQQPGRIVWNTKAVAKVAAAKPKGPPPPPPKTSWVPSGPPPATGKAKPTAPELLRNEKKKPPPPPPKRCLPGEIEAKAVVHWTKAVPKKPVPPKLQAVLEDVWASGYQEGAKAGASIYANLPAAQPKQQQHWFKSVPPPAKPSSPTPNDGHGGDPWTCQFCGSADVGVFFCNNCTRNAELQAVAKAKANYEQQVNSATKAGIPPPPANWACLCGTRNALDAFQCTSCGQLRGGAKAPAAAKPTPPVRCLQCADTRIVEATEGGTWPCPWCVPGGQTVTVPAWLAQTTPEQELEELRQVLGNPPTPVSTWALLQGQCPRCLVELQISTHPWVDDAWCPRCGQHWDLSGTPNPVPAAPSAPPEPSEPEPELE